MNKKLLGLIIAFALIGGVVGSSFSASSAALKADFLEGVQNYFPWIFGEKSHIEEGENSKKEEKSVPYVSVVDYEQMVIKAVEKASPAVVSIIISKDVPVIEKCPNNPFSDLPQEFQQFFGFGDGEQFYQPCQKGAKKQEVGGGSGFIVSSDGLIATNKHVVSDTKADYTVLTNDGKKYKAKVLARDSVLDLAIVKIEAKNLSKIELGDSDSVKLGQTAIAIGNALGEFRNTVSVGVVSGLARTITASGGGTTETIEGVIQTDAAINQGNSGGPLLNLKGEVVGVNTAMVSGAQNIGFAIPINKAKRAIESVKKTGRIVSSYLGVRYLMISEELAEKEKFPVSYGALVRGGEDGPGAAPNSPASKAGILAEDIIIELNGEKIGPEKSLASLIQKYGVGDEITLKIIRNGEEMKIKVKLGERP